MTLNKFLNSNVGVVTVIALIGGGVLYYGARKAADAVETTVNGISPTNPDNIFASGVDSVGSVLTGNDNFKLGGWIYEKIHGSSIDLITDQQKAEAQGFASGPQTPHITPWYERVFF
jgi:hypothetical protein